MAGTIVVDRIESDSSYTSTVNVASKVNFTGGMQIGGQDTTFGSMRNRIINGAMMIDQRNAGAASGIPVSVGAGYLVDRWRYAATAVGKFTAQQNQGSVITPTGFTNYLGFTSSAATAVSATDYYLFGQPIEGFNTADLGWGAANAKTVTLSFQVYSSLTGTFGGALQNGDGNRTYPFTYTISSANTWTTISVTIPGDTSGSWYKTNGLGIYVWFGLGVGSTYSGTAGSWASSTVYTATGATSVVSTNGATFYITGVQLEKGSSATAFEYRQYGQELALCQRYYETNFGGELQEEKAAPDGASVVYKKLPFQVAKRATPTVTYSTVTRNGVGFTPAACIRGSQYYLGMIQNTGGAGFDANAVVAYNWAANAEL